MGEPAFLVVEDDPLVQRSLERLFAEHGGARIASRCADASPLLRTPKWTGVVLDIGLPDGDGLELLREFRAGDASTPVLVMTGAVDEERIRRAFLLGALFLPKPPDLDTVRVFVDFALRQHRASVLVDAADRRQGQAQSLIERTSLTETQATVLRLFLIEGVPRSGLADALRLSERTLKAHATEILAKCGARSFDELRRRFDEECAGDR